MSGDVEDNEMVDEREQLAFMWGYLPGALPDRSPLLSPVPVKLPPFAGAGGSWRDVCGGGCGFAMAISESGKLITWGSTDDLGQSYVTSGKHGEIPEPFPVPTDDAIVRAAAGWAHCIAVTDKGDVFTWGWKECVPVGKVFGDLTTAGATEKDTNERTSTMLSEQVSPRSRVSKITSGTASNLDTGNGVEGAKRRRMSSTKQAVDNSSSSEENLSAMPCLVTLNPGIRMATVAAGGRHTLALSDAGQVWGWGYGGEGQLGLGSRIRMVSTPHLVPCINAPSFGKEGSGVSGSYIKRIACGGRHSAVITDAGALLTFGWGLHGQVKSWVELPEGYIFVDFV